MYQSMKQEGVRLGSGEFDTSQEGIRPGRATDFAAYSQRPRPSSGLEGPHDDQNDNGDDRDAGPFIGQAQRLFADPPLTSGEGSSEARQPAVITAQQQQQEQLGVQRSEERRVGKECGSTG